MTEISAALSEKYYIIVFFLLVANLVLFVIREKLVELIRETTNAELAVVSTELISARLQKERSDTHQNEG